jgi:hypothetical protein
MMRRFREEQGLQCTYFTDNQQAREITSWGKQKRHKDIIPCFSLTYKLNAPDDNAFINILINRMRYICTGLDLKSQFSIHLSPRLATINKKTDYERDWKPAATRHLEKL